MAIDPRIVLGVQAPDLGAAITRGLGNAESFQKLKANKLAFEDAEKARSDKAEAVEFLNTVAPFVTAGQTGGFNVSDDLLLKVSNSSVFDDDSKQGLFQALQAAQDGNPAPLNNITEMSRHLAGIGKNTATSGTASQKDFAAFQQLKDIANKTGLPQDITNAEEFGRQAGFVRPSLEDESKTAVKTAINKATGVASAGRASDIIKEMSERNRGAARSEVILRQALNLSQNASQGLTGSAKLKLSRLLPGIDSTDEAVLDATLKTLALDQLQKFKGPTTDFEYGVTESIAGSLGNSKESNIARVKSLDRARFFNEQEVKQFKKHMRAGGDPDSFRFNFGEEVKTKKGVFTLQDIQDTAVQNNLTIEETIKRLNK